MTACSSRSYWSATLALPASVSSSRRSSWSNERTTPKRLASMIAPITRSSPGQRRDHRVGHPARLQVALQAAAAERPVERDRAAAALEQVAHLVGDLGVDRLHQLAVAAGPEQGAQRRILLGAEQDDLGQLGAERLERADQQAFQRVGDLARARQRAVGLVEELEALVALALGQVGAVGGEQRHRRGRAAGGARGRRPR